MGAQGCARGKLTTMNVVGILALFCTMSEFAILTPSIAAFSHHFADTSITTIMFSNSVTGIVSVPVGMWRERCCRKWDSNLPPSQASWSCPWAAPSRSSCPT